MLPAKKQAAARAAAIVLAGVFAALPLDAQDSTARAITIPRLERAPRLEDFLAEGRLKREAGDVTTVTPDASHGAPAAIIDSRGTPITTLVQREPGSGAPARRLTTAIADPRGVAITGFVQREPGDRVPSSQPTTAYLSYDDDNLYVVFVCHDDPARVRANIARREDISEDDQVVLYLDTFQDRQRAYFFEVNPLGVQRDGIRSESTGAKDLSWDGVWSSEGRMVADGYVVRMAIPFRSLRFPRVDAQSWGVAVGRVIQRGNEESFWPPITKRVKGFLRQLGTMGGLAQISPGRNLQLTPYTMAARARVFDDDVPGHLNQSDERIGMDGKVVVRDAITFDVTANPDFSQVETDDPQVTVNERFEVQFPEKRPFFLENSGYFETPEQLFFSRRVVDPGVGLRATGKLGRWAIGALAMNDRAAVEEGEPGFGLDTWVGALRIQRAIGEESAIGVLMSDREFTGSWKRDRMYAADGRFRLGDNWELVGQVMRNENVEHDGTSVSDWGYRADMSYNSRKWDYSAGYREFGPSFEAPLGFVNRAGYRRGDADLQYTFRPKGKVVTQYGPGVSGSWLWDHTSGVLQDREMEASFAVELVANTEFEVSHQRLYELYDDLGFDLHETELQAQTEWLKWLGASVSFMWGTAVNHDPVDDQAPAVGQATEAEIGIKIRPTTQLRFEQSYVHSTLHTRPAGQHLFTERKWRAKVDYQFSRLLSVRGTFDYGWEDFNTALVDEDDPREREWSADILLTYLVHPGTAIYLGVTDARENLAVTNVGDSPEVVRTRNPVMSVGTQIFVKASYLLRF